MDGGAWWAAVHGVAQSRARLSDFTFTLHVHALEKELATHSSVLAWRIPWTEKPDRLQSMGSQRVGHDWATSLHFMFPLVRTHGSGKETWPVLSSVPETFSGKVLHSYKQNFPSLEALIFRGPKVSFELELYPPPAHFGLLILEDQQAKKEELWWFCTMWAGKSTSEIYRIHKDVYILLHPGKVGNYRNHSPRAKQ